MYKKINQNLSKEDIQKVIREEIKAALLAGLKRS